MESPTLKIYTVLSELENENELLQDENEKEIRERLIEQIIGKAIEYDAHVFKYRYDEYVKELISRGIEFVAMEKTSIATQWDVLFASSVTEAEKKNTEHYNDQYKWHLFSFELLQAAKKSEAKQKFNLQKKDTLYMFFQLSDEAFLLKNAHLLKASDFDILSEFTTMDNADMYIFDPLGKWTYIITHEATCGPYFYCTK